MSQTIDLYRIDAQIQTIKQMTEDLGQMSEDFPAAAKTTARILANIKMLELNVSDICQIGDAEINK
jgi:hypothetical protein